MEINKFKNILIKYFPPSLNYILFTLNIKKFNFNKVENQDNNLKNKNLSNLKLNNIDNDLPNLRFVLLSKKQWKLQKTKYKIINYKKKDKQIRKNKTIKYNQFSFDSSYYSISKNLCWENPAKKIHFVYYMTALPENKDRLIYSYNFYLKQYNEDIQELPLIGAKIIESLLTKLSESSNLKLLEKQTRINIFEINGGLSTTDAFKKIKLLRRLKLIRCFRLQKIIQNGLFYLFYQSYHPH